MTRRASEDEIRDFLSEAKTLLSVNKYDFVQRRKNMQDLAANGLTISDVKSQILSLEVEDYYKGPKQDFDRSKPGDIWEFKKNIDDVRFYVKLKITKVNGIDILRCLGFHEDEFA